MPPTTAPGGLSRPPSTAATNPPIRTGSKLFGPRNTAGATSTPAIAPTSAASAQPNVNIPPTRTPSNRATSGANADARIRRPSEVARNSSASSTATTTTTSTMNVSFGVNSRVVPPTLYPWSENAAGKERGVLPQIIPAPATSSVYRPRVTITAFSGGADSTGRIRTRSTTAPSISPEASATKNPSGYEPVFVITAEAMKVVTISIAPCAKLTIRVARQISTSASATAAYTAPSEMPLSVRSMNLVTSAPQNPR